MTLQVTSADDIRRLPRLRSGVFPVQIGRQDGPPPRSAGLAGLEERAELVNLAANTAAHRLA